MKPLVHLLLAAGLTLSIAANAALLSPPPSEASLDSIHDGFSRDDVRKLAGAPENVTPTAHGGSMWVYEFTDDWGYRSEFDVTFDANGIVQDAESERLDY
jgi:outer membrane protein assembly factor BamE (lipoprotein component of BamABCDE complex)